MVGWMVCGWMVRPVRSCMRGWVQPRSGGGTSIASPTNPCIQLRFPGAQNRDFLQVANRLWFPLSVHLDTLRRGRAGGAWHRPWEAPGARTGKLRSRGLCGPWHPLSGDLALVWRAGDGADRTREGRSVRKRCACPNPDGSVAWAIGTGIDTRGRGVALPPLGRSPLPCANTESALRADPGQTRGKGVSHRRIESPGWVDPG
jgi:hypothetical protein